jgi:hypothetical protein
MTRTPVGRTAKWATSGNRTPFHIEGTEAPAPGAPGATPETRSSLLVVEFQLPPLALVNKTGADRAQFGDQQQAADRGIVARAPNGRGLNSKMPQRISFAGVPR